MILATVDGDSKPSARVMLIKHLSRSEGYAAFYSNYQSRKAMELERNVNAAGVLHWDKLGRQVRFEGCVVRAPESESDAYFSTRPAGSQINAWVSAQSQPIENRALLERRAREKAREFGVAAKPTDAAASHNHVPIPRPPFWGGYRFWFSAVELWLEGSDRFHERLRYERSLTPSGACAFSTGPWTCERLRP